MDVTPFRYRILLVDDDERIRTTAHALLEAQGYVVLCAADGFEGLSALKQSLPDVIISDLRMPNMNGFERKLRSKNCAGPLVPKATPCSMNVACGHAYRRSPAK
jgi:CheY-like chemotaxis protein